MSDDKYPNNIENGIQPFNFHKFPNNSIDEDNSFEKYFYKYFFEEEVDSISKNIILEIYFFISLPK